MSTEELIKSNSDLALTTLGSRYDNVSQDTLIKVAAKYLGYKKLPPDIDTFLDDPFYLGNVVGNLYPFWREQLRDIFPTRIHTKYPILVITGSIGSGKSTVSRIINLYNICRLDHLEDPHRTMGLIGGKKIVFDFLMPNKSNADIEFPGTLHQWMDQSPYFRDSMLNGFDRYEYFSEGLVSRGGPIGRDVLGYVLSELNFMPYEKAFNRLDTAFKRWSSRFKRFTDYFGYMIIDTSSNRDDSIADDFAKSNPYGDKVKVIRTSEWVVKKHLNYYFRKGSFKVYAGDALHSPFIITKDNPITPDLDTDRVIEVPEELRPDFEFNIVKALNDQAGISTTATDRFIQEPELIAPCFNIPMVCQDVIEVDFYDPHDKLIYQVEEAVRTIPTDKIVFIHYDIGVTGDIAGIGLSYFDSWKDYGVDKDNNKMRLPRIKVPLAVGLGRKKDQETSIFKMQEFVIDLSERFEVYFSADQFASRQLLQNLEMVGIKSKYISVDRTDQPYIYLKTLLQNHLVDLPKNKRLQFEISNLKRVGNKIDHDADKSKDISDAVTGSIFHLYQNLDIAGQLSSKYIAQQTAQAFQQRGQTPSDRFQDMIRNIW